MCTSSKLPDSLQAINPLVRDTDKSGLDELSQPRPTAFLYETLFEGRGVAEKDIGVCATFLEMSA